MNKSKFKSSIKEKNIITKLQKSFLKKYIKEAVKVSGKEPVLIDKFLDDAAEIGVKAISFVSDGESTCSPHLYDAIMRGKANGLDMALGTNGYLLKDEKPGRILEALNEAMEGGAPMSPAIANKALQIIRGKTQMPKQGNIDFDLTKRELEILHEISTGHSYQSIAAQLFISSKTVSKHIENIYLKLQVHNKLDAVKIAQQNNLL